MRIDEKVFSEDLTHNSKAARAVIEPVIRRWEKKGIELSSLKKCDPEHREGTELPGCRKVYIGKWGAVFKLDREDSVLVLLAVGDRHPDKRKRWRPSVYQVAHRRLWDRT